MHTQTHEHNYYSSFYLDFQQFFSFSFPFPTSASASAVCVVATFYCLLYTPLLLPLLCFASHTHIHMHSIETRALPLLLLSLWVICFREHLYCVLCFALCFLHTHTQRNSARAVALQTRAETSTAYINVRYISALCSLLLLLSSSSTLLFRHLSHETQRKFLAVKRAMLHIIFTLTFNYFALFCMYLYICIHRLV